MRLNVFFIILIFIIISIIITLNIFFQQNYQQEMAGQFNKQQLLIAKAVASSIKSSFHHIEEEIKAIERLLSRRGLGKKGLNEFIFDAFAEEHIEKGISMKIYDHNGRLVFPEGNGNASSEEDTEIIEFAQRLSSKKVSYFDRIIGERKVKIAYPIRENKRSLGVIVVDIHIDALNNKYLSPIKSGKRGYTWMMDGSGTLVYHPTQPDMVGKNIYSADESCFRCHTSFKTEALILSTPDVGFSAYVSPKGEDKLVAFSRVSISHMSWIVCVSIPYSEVTMSIQNSMKMHSMLVLSIFSLTVIGAFVIVASNRRRVKAEEKARHFERRKALEHEIIDAKNYLENILESTQTFIMVIGEDLIVKTVNSAYGEMFGVPKEDILERNFLEVFPFTSDGNRKKIGGMVEDCLKGRIELIKDFPIESGRKKRWLNIVLSPLKIRDSISGVILSGSDITEETNLKERIKEYAHELEKIVMERTKELMSEKEKLNAIVESIEAGICIFDGEKNLIWTNRVMRNWLSEEKSTGLTLDGIYSGKYSFDALKHAIVDNKFVQEIVYNDFGRKAGYFQVVSTPLINPDGESMVLVLIQDVTDIKAAEEQMMQSEKLSALARLSAGVAHEIGNPLTSVSSYVQILKEMDFDDFTKDALATISRQISRIATIVRRMSSHVKTDHEDIREHDIKELIDSTLQLVRYDGRMKRMEIKEEIAHDLPRVRVNGDKLEQVFINILLNAADAMPDGGALTIKAFRDRNNIDVEFRDTGKGIPDNYGEKIFEPFFTTKEKGTGLGLSVSYTIVRSFGGTILCSSIPGKGAVFTVRLPIYEG